MPELQTQLRAYGDQLDRQFPAVSLVDVTDARTRVARPPSTARRWPAVVAVAAAVLLLASVALFGPWFEGSHEPPVVTTPEPPPAVEASEWPLGVIIAGESGIAVVGFDAPDEPILLRSDDRYRGISFAISDHRGGLIFSHDITPPPWAPGSLMWLRAGASTPEVLFEPEGDTIPGHSPVVGMATSAAGHALLVYAETGHGPRLTSRIMVADLDDGGSVHQIAELDGTVDESFGRYWLSAGGGVVVVFGATGESSDCFTVTVMSVDDGSHVPAGIDCIDREGVGPWPTVSHDGRSLWVRRESTVTVIDLASGETLDEGTIGTGDYDSTRVSSPGGWLAVLATETELRLVGLDGVVRLRIELVGLGTLMSGFHLIDFYHHPLVLAPPIGLGSGTGDVPCRPIADELEHQDLPEPVAATRRLLFELAASCDYEGLAALAVAHATHLVVDEGVSYPPGGDSEERLVSSWIAAGLTEPQAAGMRSREPLASLAALLGTRPAYVKDTPDWPVYVGPRDHPDFNHDPGGCVWVWPALYVGVEGDPGDRALWHEHYDYRIGIDADGMWRFFMAHFYEPGVSPQPALCGD
jgi:hypothetical protein